MRIIGGVDDLPQRLDFEQAEPRSFVVEDGDAGT
jgi:hypothetical protein